ncbi:MAG: exopolyphosphatase [Acidimicrobiales bacterium]
MAYGANSPAFEPGGVTAPGLNRDNRGEVLAAIDVGTNSFHLVVARMLANGRFETMASEKEMVRLGSGSGDMKHLSDQAMDRGVAALGRFRRVAHINGARIRAVATSAVREALNQDRFIERARNEAGVEVEVISGTEEARLIHLGVLQALPVFNNRLLLVDIGGGSTEILVATGPDIEWSRSHKLGAIRLTDRFFPEGRTSARRAERCRRYLESFLINTALELRHRPFDIAVGSSGTIQNLAQMAAHLRGEGQPKSINSASFSRAELSKLTQLLVDQPTATERMQLPGIESRRADILPAGALLLDTLAELLHIEKFTVSAYALREGVLLDAARNNGHHRHLDPLHHLSDLRRAGVEHLLAVTDPAVDHAHRAAELALQLFAQTAARHQLPEDYAELLEAGALLANAGRTIAHEAHHKHSYYVIRNSDQLSGFTSHEIELIAQVSRYHRKSSPKAGHAEFGALTPADQQAVRVMAGLLRIAIGLDRGHQGAIDAVDCTLDESGGHLTIRAVGAPDRDTHLEIYTADARKGLAEAALNVTITVEAVSAIAGSDPVQASLITTG